MTQLKRIPVDQLRVGMHLHAFEGAWLTHPFWRTQFTIDDAATVRRVQASPVRECWIDASKGLDVPPAAAGNGPAESSAPTAAPNAAPPAEPTAAAATRPPPPEAPVAEARTDMASELLQAAVLCRRSREAVTTMFTEARLGKVIETERFLPLVDDIARSVFRNPGALVSLARLKNQDDYTYMHSVAVCALMVMLARELGHDDDACRQAGMAGLLHDMGKALLPLEILQKPGRLTAEEFTIVRNHPQLGFDLLQQSRGAPEAALEVCLHHHERPDGRGYPHGLSDAELGELATWVRCAMSTMPSPPTAPTRPAGTRPNRSRRWPAGTASSTNGSSAPSCAAWASTRWARWCA